MAKKIRSFLAAFGLFISSFAWLGTIQVGAATDTCTWTGGGSDDNFSTAANWTGCDNGTIPEDGDSLTFPVADATPNNDLGGITVVTTLTISADTTITGDPIGMIDVVMGTAVTGYLNTSIVSIAGSATVTGGGTLNIGADDTSTLEFFDSSASLTSSADSLWIYSKIVGDGDISVSSLAVLNSNSPDFNGEVNITSGSDFYVMSSGALGAASAGTSVADGSSISFCDTSASDVTYAEPLTLTGEGVTGITLGPKLNVIKGNCFSGGGTPTRPFPYTVFTGAITLGGDVEWSGYGRDAKITGALSGTGYKITVKEGVDFKLVNEASPNSTDTPSGTISSVAKTTTYTGDQSATNPFISSNQIGIVSDGATLGNVTLDGGTLKGVGTTGTISMSSGKVAPGLSPGCLNTGNVTYTGGTEEIEIGGTTACSGYDQQIVTGTVDLGSATTLTVVRWNGFYPAVGNTFTIINNDAADAVTGTFSGMAEAATFTQDGVTYRINYAAGDGNDVVLTVMAVPGAPNTGAKPSSLIWLITLGIATLCISGGLLSGRRKNVK